MVCLLDYAFDSFGALFVNFGLGLGGGAVGVGYGADSKGAGSGSFPPPLQEKSVGLQVTKVEKRSPLTKTSNNELTKTKQTSKNVRWSDES